MQKKKLKWKGLDDKTIVEPSIPKDKSDTNIALSAQSIRTFTIEYKEKKQKQHHGLE